MDEDEEDRPFRCKTCGKRFPRRQNLQSHILSHTHFARYQCPICDKKYVYGHEFKVHMNQHNGIRPHKCHLCEKSFYRLLELKIHLNSTLHAGKKPWKCEYKNCNKSFSQHAHLQAHKRMHTGEKPHTCGVCGKKFTQSSHLRSHMLFHTGEKPHQCTVCTAQHRTVCQLKFRLKTSLNSHMRTHTGEKPYKCPHCLRAFSQYTPMMEHIQKTHRNETFSCSGCNKAFSTKQQVKRHERGHLGPFKFSCVFCGRQGNVKYTMACHIRRHIGEKPYFCRKCKCGNEFPSAQERNRHERRKKTRAPRLKMGKSRKRGGDTLGENKEEKLGHSIKNGLGSPPQKMERLDNGLSTGDTPNGVHNIDTVIKKSGGSHGENDFVPLETSPDPMCPMSAPTPEVEIDDSIVPGQGENEDDKKQETARKENITKGRSNSFQSRVCQKTFNLKPQLNDLVSKHRKPAKRRRTFFQIKRKRRKQELPKETDPPSDDSTSPPSLQRPLNLTSISDSDDLLITEQMPRLQKQPKILESPPIVSPQQRAFDMSAVRLAKENLKRQRMAALNPFRCPQCSYIAACPLSIQLHVQLVHLGVECHKCTRCWKSFPSGSRQREHQLAEHDMTTPSRIPERMDKLTKKVKTELGARSGRIQSKDGIII